MSVPETRRKTPAAAAPTNGHVGDPLDQYRRLIESLTDYAIFSLSTTGLITSWNSGAQFTFGYDSQDVLGHHYSLIFTDEDIASDLPEKELSAAIATGKASCDGWHVRKDGSRLWCTDTVQPLRDPDGVIVGFTKIVRDTTEKHLAGELLRESEERLRLLIEGVTDYAIFSIDVAGRILLWNSGAEKLFGYTSEQIVGKSFALLYTAEALRCDVPSIELQTAVIDGQATDEAWHVRRDGSRFFASGQMKRLEHDPDGHPRGFVKIAHDITERVKVEEAMTLRAFSDDLTHLQNRAAFGESLRRTIAETLLHPNRRFALIFLDLDQFKIINDSLGHGIADGLLVHVARTLERCVRPGDSVARLGGDEFTILLVDLRNENEALHIAERIQAALAQTVNLGGAEVYTTASMGIAMGPGGYETAEQVLRDADTAMYEAKARGRARYVVFDSAMHDRAVHLLNLQADIRQALRREEFWLAYQPIVSLELGSVCGFEALIRWEHPRRGTVHPNDFIGAAESLGLIVEMDLWVLERATQQLSIWRASGGADELTISVNVSAKLFVSENLVQAVQGALERNALPARCLKLEITETTLMQNLETASVNIGLLGQIGVGLSIDDFGTGYSSLSYLKRFPLQVLKVDRSFVRDIALDPRSAEIAQTIVMLAHNLGLEAVAEGIETYEQLVKLRAMGCAFGQGYFFSRPVVADVAQDFIGAILPAKRIGFSSELAPRASS
jgi:diguanylate cyclase (GGDEF)-like protein/PAS domain S-box-containing protein